MRRRELHVWLRVRLLRIAEIEVIYRVHLIWLHCFLLTGIQYHRMNFE